MRRGGALADAQKERKALVRDDPANPRHRFDLAHTIVARGDLARDEERLPEALASWTSARWRCCIASSRRSPETCP